MSFHHEEILAGHDLLSTVVAGDIDGDHDEDLIVVGIYPYDDAIFSVHKNRGDGTFDDPVLYTIRGDPRCAQLVDIDGDSDLDLIISNSLAGHLFVYQNPGNGEFGDPVGDYVFPSGVRPIEFVAKDIDGDKMIDVAVSDAYGSVWVLWNAGNGILEYGPHYDLLPDGFLYEIVAEDLDGDQLTDLAVMAIPYDAPTYTVLYDEAKVFILFNDGNRGFGQQATFDIPSWPNLALVGADLDGDGDVDLIGVNSANARPEPYGMWILFNDGKGHFSEATVYSAGSYPLDVHFADVDGDGDLDAVVPDYGNDSVNILLNDGHGSFLDQRVERAGSRPEAAIFSDLNGDSRPDIVDANFSGYGHTPTLSIFYNLCDTEFQIDFNADGEVNLLDGSIIASCLAGPSNTMKIGCKPTDFEGDGDVDIFDWARFQVAFRAQ